MTKEDSSRDIDQAAAQWAARLDRGPLTDREERELDDWLNGDARARGALLRAQAVSMLSQSAVALGPNFNPRDFEEVARSHRMMSRRNALAIMGGAVGAGSLMAFGFGVSSAGAVSRTGRGELRLVPLKDGSTVLLNTSSGIRVRYDGRERKVILLDGEAYFSVTRDARPFILDVKGQRLRATQANFCVRNLDGHPLDVLVNEGEVHVFGHSAFGRPRTTGPLGASMRLVFDDAALAAGPRFQKVAPETVSRELAWREGKLAFEGESLQQAAATFARYSDVRIEIADADLARQPVTGLFAANDPVGFSRAVSRVFDAQLQVGARKVVLARSASQG